MRRALHYGSILILVVAISAACSTSSPRQTTLMQNTKMTISAAELRIQVRSLAGRFSGLMENAGEQVLRSDPDPVVHRRALLWLTNGIPAMQQALFQPDPLAALIDSWFLVAQMRQYFEAAENRGTPSKYGQKITAVADEMEADIKMIVENSGPNIDFESAREMIYSKAQLNEIDVTFASRLGTAAFLAEFTAATGGGAFQAIGSITETVSDLVARIDLNAEYIPKYIRWHAELLIMDEIKGDEDYDLIVRSIENLQYLEMVGALINDLGPIVDELPNLVAEERMAILAEIEMMLAETQAFVNRQRAVVMTEDVPAERRAIFDAIESERLAVLAALAEERQIVLEAVSTEREAVFADLDRLISTAFARELEALFLRALVLIVILLAGLALVAFFTVRALKRKG